MLIDILGASMSKEIKVVCIMLAQLQWLIQIATAKGAFTWAPWCASNVHPIWISCVHMNAHWLDAHPMRIGCKSDRIHLLRWHSNRITLIFMIHARLRLLWDRWLGWLYSLAWLMARVYCSFLFYSCSNIREEKVLVCWWPSRVVQHGKIKSIMVPLSTVLKFDVL